MRNYHSKAKFVLEEFPDMRLFMSAALRYSLGRKTYAANHFMDYLENNIDMFSDTSLVLFQQDLEYFHSTHLTSESEVIQNTRRQAQKLCSIIEDKISNE